MTCLTNFPDLDSQYHANWSIDGPRVQAGAHVFYLSCSTPISHIVGLACLQLVIYISCCTKFVVVPVYLSDGLLDLGTLHRSLSEIPTHTLLG